MLYDCGYVLTEDEINAGLYSLLCNNNEGTIKIEELTKLKMTNLQKKVTKKIAGLRNKKLINIVTAQLVINFYIDVAIDSYQVKENLPFYYVDIAKEQNGLEYLFKNFFKNELSLKLNKELIKKINEFVDIIYFETENKIVYDRVKRIQHFIHKEVDELLWINKHLELNKISMKNFLSASRLHLEIKNLELLDVYSLIKLWKKQIKEIDKDLTNPSFPKLLKNQKYVKNWKTFNWHYNPLILYAPDGFRTVSTVQSFLNISTTQPINNQIKEIINEVGKLSTNLMK